MGWSNRDLREFRIRTKTGKNLVLCNPKESQDALFDFKHENVFPDWMSTISEYKNILPHSFQYTYNFVGGWDHNIRLEKVVPADPNISYPRCIQGERACPIENCGGIWEYQKLLKILAKPEHKEYEDMLDWLDSFNGKLLDPEYFNPSEVEFSNPMELLKVELNRVTIGWDDAV
jgi:hypothetical protein